MCWGFLPTELHDGSHDSSCRLPVAIWILDMRHAFVGFAIIQKTKSLCDHPFLVRSQEANGARRDALRTLRRVAHHEDRLPQARRLFLYPPGIRKDQRAAPH